MSTKTALVTGGTDGVGLSVVRALAKEGFEVWFIGQSEEKGARAVAELKGRGHFVRLDLSDLAAVKKFAADFKKQHERLDVLLFSAGVMLPKRQETVQGLEKTLAIGYLSAFILSNELIPLLEKSGRARVLYVAGGKPLVMRARLDFGDLNLAKDYSGPRAALRTVHAKTVLAEILAKKFAARGITFNSLHPGIVKSDLARSLPGPLSVVAKGASSLFFSKESTAAIHGALSPSMEGVNGKFIVGRKASSMSFDEAYREKLWHETEKLLAGALKS